MTPLSAGVEHIINGIGEIIEKESTIVWRLIILSLLTVSLVVQYRLPLLDDKIDKFLPELEVITVENAPEIEELARFGQGVIDSVEWAPDGSHVAVLTPAGVWIYDFQDLHKAPRLIPTRGAAAISPNWNSVEAAPDFRAHSTL